MSDVRRFVATRRADWERLEALLVRWQRLGLRQFQAAEIRELGRLHRQAAADLAAARTWHGDTRLVDYLNALALRSHNAVYRAPRRSPWRRLATLGREVPAAVRRHLMALAATTAIFGCGVLFGAVGTAIDESVVTMMVGEYFVDQVREGRFWVENIFSVAPRSWISAGLLANNLSVALVLFAAGITGIQPVFGLFFNGMMLGSVGALCASHGLLPRFVPFVMTHGVIEISALLLAGAAGLVIFDGWLHPGDASRAAGLRRAAREALLVAAAAVPALLVAGVVESFIAPVERLAAGWRIGLGLALGLALWTWLLATPEPTQRDAPL